jgi:hypothetical protein
VASDRSLPARVASLEQLIQRRDAEGRTTADVLTDAGFSDAEMERLEAWLTIARRVGLGSADLQDRADWLATAAGSKWLHCRLQHGSGVCDVAFCPGKFLHQPPWRPHPRSP